MKLFLTRKVTTDECPWLPRDLAEGDVVYAWHGATYGCVSPGGMAISFEEGENPFYEIPGASAKGVTP